VYRTQFIGLSLTAFISSVFGRAILKQTTARSRLRAGFVALVSMFLLVGISKENGFSAACQDGGNRPRLIAQLAEDKINIKGELRLTIILMNDSDEPITIYRKLDIGWWTGLIPKITDERGRRFHNDVIEEPPFKERPVGGPIGKIPVSDFVTIGPKESFTFKRVIYVYNYLSEANPGRYSITLTYENPLPPKVIPPSIHVWSVPPESIKTEPLYFVMER
jgi:hypothetical protein